MGKSTNLLKYRLVCGLLFRDLFKKALLQWNINPYHYLLMPKPGINDVPSQLQKNMLHNVLL